jgi:hypothetical protein
MITELLVNKDKREAQKFFKPLFALFDGCTDISKFC